MFVFVKTPFLKDANTPQINLYIILANLIKTPRGFFFIELEKLPLKLTSKNKWPRKAELIL